MTKRDCQGWHAKLMVRIATVGLTFCLGPPGLQADEPPDRGSGSPPPPPALHRGPPLPHAPDSTPAETPPDVSELSAQRTALNPLLVRDRRLRLLLTRGDTALLDGQTLAGVAQLQALLDSSQDAFFWPDDSLRPQGAWSEVLRRVHASSEIVRRDYERLHGAAARDLLERFNDSHDDRLLVELMRRYGPTTAARDAAVHQLLLSHDTGRSTRAQEWARFLESDPSHWSQLTSHVQRLVMGQERRPRGFAPASFVANRPLARPVTHFVSTGEVQVGHADTSAPYPVPLWTSRFDSDLPQATIASDNEHPGTDVAQVVRDSYNDWLAHRTEYRLPIATSHESVVSDDVLIVRDFTHVRAFNLETGRVQWKFACESSLAAAAQSLERAGHGNHAGGLDFHAHFSGNSVFGRLTTDGSRVYVIDKCTPDAQTPNRLVAIAIEPESPAGSSTSHAREVDAVWMRGKHSGLANDDLANSALLGSPLCVDDRLYLLGEHERQISLFALDAATGRTIWKQGVSLVEKPVAEDAVRLRTACTPVYDDGIICCPTELGIVVGVDALSGRLEWVYDHMDTDQRGSSGRWAFSNGRHADHSLLPNRPFVHRGRLIYLPARSRFVHCVDTATGNMVWAQLRYEAHAIGEVTDSLVLLLGDRECRAINLTDGNELWRTPTPEPAGTGIVAGSQYLLPTTNGPCLSIALQNGQIGGQPFGQMLHELWGADHSPAGNLISHRDLIVATTPQGVRVYPQARHRLEQLSARAVEGRLATADQLLHAQLLLTLGEQDAAGDTLQRLLDRDCPHAIRLPAERLLREVLYAQLDDAADSHPKLIRLAELAHTEDENLRLQLSRVLVAIRENDADLLTESLDEFLTLPGEALISINGNDEYVVSAESCLRDRLASLRNDERRQLSEALDLYLLRASDQLADATDVAQLNRFVMLFGDWPQIASSKSTLARRWLSSGRDQDAELLLLAQCSGTQTTAVAPARRLLAELYSRHGFEQAAIRHQHIAAESESLGPTWKHRLTGFGATDASLAMLQATLSARLPSKPPTTILQTAMSPATAGAHVEITEHRCIGDCSEGERCACRHARLVRENMRRAFVPSLTSSLLVLDQGIMRNKRTHSLLTLVDRNSGVPRSEIEVPSAYWQMPRPCTVDAGHVMVIGGDAAHGISLLEGRTLWSFVPETSGRKSQKIKVGPTCSDICVLQMPYELRVVHTASGRTLWSRTHLPPGVGLLANESVGIIGDSHTLCVFDGDQISYTVFHAQSGREIRHGSRPLTSGESRRNRWAVGRQPVDVVADATGCRLCIWDSRDDRTTYDVLLTDRLVAPLPGEEEFACLTSEGHLQVVRASDSELLLDMPVSVSQPLGAISKLTAFADRDRFFFNLAGESDEVPLGVVAATDDLDLPHVRVRGRLLTVDRHSGRVLWDREVQDACVPITPELSPAILALISRTAEDRPSLGRGRTHDPASLMLEVLDAATGNTLARHNRLLKSRIVGYRCPPSDETDSDGSGSQRNPSRDATAPRDSSSAILASLIGVDSRIDIRASTRPVSPPVRVAAEESITTER